ncbi:MAG TPA: protein kinase [Polyangiaceae bacterium]
MTERGEERRVGELVGGKYRLVRFIAAGGMGVVYEAQHRVVKRRFAVKFLRPELTEKRESLARFQREAEAAGALESEHVAAAVDFGVAADGSPFIVMEYLTGESLAALVEREGPLPLERAADLVRQACRGVQTAHAAGIVHRDLKPHNLYLCRREDGTDLVKVLDFGVAKLEATDRGDTATRTGTVLGTPSSMSPEQARGEKTIDHRADVYALGAVAYELVSGRKPHPGETHNAILHHIATQPALPLDFVEPALPTSLVEAIERALSPEPAARFDSADDLARALAPFAERRVWPAPERPASSPRNDAVSPTELAPNSAGRARVPPPALARSRPEATSRRATKATLVVLAALAALVVWLTGRTSAGPDAAASAPSALLAARPRAAEVNATEAPLPVTVHTEPAPPASFAPPHGTARVRAPRPKPTNAESSPVPVVNAPEPAASTRPLAFDRQNPYD